MKTLKDIVNEMNEINKTNRVINAATKASFNQANEALNSAIEAQKDSVERLRNFIAMRDQQRRNAEYVRKQEQARQAKIEAWKRGEAC